LYFKSYLVKTNPKILKERAMAAFSRENGSVSTKAAFYLTLATLVELFHPCYLSNVKQGQMMLASVASVKWNAA